MSRQIASDRGGNGSRCIHLVHRARESQRAIPETRNGIPIHARARVRRVRCDMRSNGITFGGWKGSLFGDLHVHGMEGVKFYTRTKVITSRWPHQDTPAPGLNMPTLG